MIKNKYSLVMLSIMKSENKKNYKVITLYILGFPILTYRCFPPIMY